MLQVENTDNVVDLVYFFSKYIMKNVFFIPDGTRKALEVYIN